MLEISPTQMAAFENAEEAKFRQQLFDLLVSEYPEHARDHDGVRAVVAVGMADAREAGLKSAQGIALYVTAAFLLGMTIKDDPNVLREIRHSGADEAAKIAWLGEWLIAIEEEVDA